MVAFELSGSTVTDVGPAAVVVEKKLKLDTHCIVVSESMRKNESVLGKF